MLPIIDGILSACNTLSSFSLRLCFLAFSTILSVALTHLLVNHCQPWLSSLVAVLSEDVAVRVRSEHRSTLINPYSLSRSRRKMLLIIHQSLSGFAKKQSTNHRHAEI